MRMFQRNYLRVRSLKELQFSADHKTSYIHTQLFSTRLSFTRVNARKTHILKCIMSKLKEVLDESLLQVPSFAIL